MSFYKLSAIKNRALTEMNDWYERQPLAAKLVNHLLGAPAGQKSWDERARACLTGAEVTADDMEALKHLRHGLIWAWKQELLARSGSFDPTPATALRLQLERKYLSRLEDWLATREKAPQSADPALLNRALAVLWEKEPEKASRWRNRLKLALQDNRRTGHLDGVLRQIVTTGDELALLLFWADPSLLARPEMREQLSVFWHRQLDWTLERHRELGQAAQWNKLDELWHIHRQLARQLPPPEGPEATRAAELARQSSYYKKWRQNHMASLQKALAKTGLEKKLPHSSELYELLSAVQQLTHNFNPADWPALPFVPAEAEAALNRLLRGQSQRRQQDYRQILNHIIASRNPRQKVEELRNYHRWLSQLCGQPGQDEQLLETLKKACTQELVHMAAEKLDNRRGADWANHASDIMDWFLPIKSSEWLDRFQAAISNVRHGAQPPTDLFTTVQTIQPPRLVLLANRAKMRHTVVFFQDHISLGRSPQNDIKIALPWISGRHARLDFTRGSLDDLGSTNGTWLDNTRCEHITLDRPREVLLAGRTTLTLHSFGSGHYFRIQDNNLPDAPGALARAEFIHLSEGGGLWLDNEQGALWQARPGLPALQLKEGQLLWLHNGRQEVLPSGETVWADWSLYPVLS